MNFFIIWILCFASFIFFIIWFAYITSESNSITLVGQYTVYNYTSGDVIVFILSKEKLDESIILTNENDETEKILITRIPYQ